MEYADELRWYAPDPDAATDDPAYQDRGSLWRDLRPSEADRLRTLLSEAETAAVTAAHELIIRKYTTALLAFGAEYPNAPRREPVA